jgi:MFS family permease
MTRIQIRVARSRPRAPPLKSVGPSERLSPGYVPPLERSGGTEGSKPVPSTGESDANLTASIRAPPVFVRLVLGMGESATLPAATRALSNWTSLAARGTAVGITHAAGRLGAGASAPIVALLITWFSGAFPSSRSASCRHFGRPCGGGASTRIVAGIPGLVALRSQHSVAQLLWGHVTCGDAVRTEEDALRKGASLGPLAYLPLA